MGQIALFTRSIVTKLLDCALYDFSEMEQPNLDLARIYGWK